MDYQIVEKNNKKYIRLNPDGNLIQTEGVQKFVQYGVKAAVVLDQDKITGRFKDFLTESNKGNQFRAYAGFEEAEAWLLNSL